MSDTPTPMTENDFAIAAYRAHRGDVECAGVVFAEYKALLASLTTDRTALATLREAARSIPEDADEFCRLFAGQPATAPQHAAFLRSLAVSLTALRALTADHEEGGT